MQRYEGQIDKQTNKQTNKPYVLAESGHEDDDK